MLYSVNTIFVVVVGVLLFGCATNSYAKIDRVSGDVRGMIYDLDRRPVSEAIVTIHAKERNESARSDIHGRFGFGDIGFGPIELLVTKSGYEPGNIKLLFSDPTVVVYHQMPNADQLFELATVALTKKDWQSFRESIDRARRLAPDSLQGTILEAAALELSGTPRQAITLLEKYSSPTVELARELYLGDLYFSVEDYQNALIHWQKGLEVRASPEVEEKVRKAKALSNQQQSGGESRP